MAIISNPGVKSLCQKSKTPPALAAWRFNLKLDRRKMIADTIAFSRREIQFQPRLVRNSPKLNLRRLKHGGIQTEKFAPGFMLKLMNYTAEACSIWPVLTQALNGWVRENTCREEYY